MDSFALSTVDLVVMVVYAVLIIGYGLYSAKAQTSEEYFLAGRNMTWPIVGISLFAANISSSTLVGLAGDAYKTNTQVFNYEWLASVVLVFFAIFFLPFYLKSRVYTMPEFLERRYDVRSRYYFSFITIVGNVLIDTAAGLFVGTVILKLLFPSLSTFAIVAILAIAAAAYTVPGGLNSVIQTEVIQAILLVIGSCFITYYTFDSIGGWDEMIAGLNEMGANGTLPNPNDIREVLVGPGSSLASFVPADYDLTTVPQRTIDGITYGVYPADVLEGANLSTVPFADRIYDDGIYQPTTADEVLSLVRPTGDTWREFFLGSGGDGFMPWTGLLFGAPILGFYFWANNQFMVQRVLGAKDINHGRWGALFAGLLKLPVLFIMVLPGTAAIVYLQQQSLLPDGFNFSEMGYKFPNGDLCENLKDCPNATYPMLMFKMLPTGVLGLVLAGLMAAMMSSVSATFNSASTLITMDFAAKLYPNLTSKQLVRTGQVSTLVLVVLACLWAPQIEKFDSLFEYLQIVLSFIAPPVAAAFILGLFWKRANGTGAFVSLMVGAALTIMFIFVINSEGDSWLKEMHFLHRTFYLFVLCMIINAVVSLATDPPAAAQIDNYTWSSKLIAEETEELSVLPWYQNYRYQAVMLLIITFILVGYFW
ncbi:sodium:solute symporter [Neolewinella antarctica]|uniref:SSS family solute:Na+ symporter n=1 Tax=Neolewinella antarctica TaxID=442734 RepID=A0ABX0X7A6_9BACT|nr:sodium:solute symporter [Neolewinella antarctica]NJC24753.1 SSS family solute:Na+ symporter [Neolewinella antarctica]